MISNFPYKLSLAGCSLIFVLHLFLTYASYSDKVKHFCTCLEIYQKKLSTRRHSRRTRYPLKRACSSQFADRNAFTSASLFQGGVNPDANNLTEAVSVVLPVCVQSIFLDDSFHNKLCAITVC